MSELISKLLSFSAAGVGFITPRVFVQIGNDIKEIAKDALQFGYVAMFATNGKPESVTDVTKFEAGASLLGIIEQLPEDSTFSFYMPASLEVRESSDLNQWVKAIDVTTANMLTSARTLAQASEVMTPAITESVNLAKTSGLTASLASLPTYGATGNGKGKRSSGKTPVTLETLFK